MSTENINRCLSIDGRCIKAAVWKPTTNGLFSRWFRVYKPVAVLTGVSLAKNKYLSDVIRIESK